MKPLKLLVGLAFILFAYQHNTFSQVFLSEGFESGIPTTWSQEPEVGNEYWKFRNGGHSPNDPNWDVPASSVDITRNPPLAHSGTYNAIFFKQSNNREKTKLITPPINLSGTIKPELSFWVVQVPWTFSGTTNWDQQRIYYRTSATAEWVLLLEILDPLYDWTEYRVNLPNPSATYQIAFEGETFWGYGTCIDDVIVEEKGLVERWISEITVNQASLNFVPTGSFNAPILRLDFKVYGNTGEATLQSLSVKSLNTNDTDIPTNGVKLYTTSTAIFAPDNPLTSATSFNVDGDAVFNSINHALPDGLSYLWVAYDIAENATHNNRVDAMIKANSILANDTLYPSIDLSPLGYRVINKKVYLEDFEGVHNWTLTSAFTVGTPNGLGGTPGNPDPIGAASGNNAVFHPGNYAANLTEETAYKATSPTLNLQHYKNIKLSYNRYLNIEYWDKSSVQISTNNGSTWSPIWASNNYFTDFQWNHTEHSIGSSFWRSPNTKIRFQMGPSDGVNNYSGFSFDDVIITGEFISKDVGVVEWVSPVTGCGHTSSETVVVKVANLGGAAIIDPVPVQFSMNGGVTWITNTLNQVIPVGDIVTFTFTTKANLSEPGLRSDVRARTNLTDDQFTANNQITTQIYALPTYTSPVNLSFKTENKHWRSFGQSLWQHGIPIGATIDPSTIGAKSWVTSTSQSYGNSFSGTTSTIFDDDFETDKGWTFVPEFERAIASWDHFPYGAWSDDYFIGTDLSGTGANPYYYESGITEGTAYTATSPPINVNQYANVTFGFYRYFIIAEGDYAKIEVSPDNTNWHTIWENNGAEVYDWGWDEFIYTVDDIYTYSTEFRVRFSLFSTSSVAEGLYIDDFFVKGDIVTTSPAYLESPCFNFTDAVEPMVELNLWVDTEADVDGASLEYTLDGGTTWSLVNNTTPYDTYWNWYKGKNVSALGTDGWSGQTNGWITSRQVLPAVLAGESNVKFRLNFMCDGKNNDFDGIAVEDFNVFELPFDLGVSQILNPSSPECHRSATEAISVRIQNYGIRDMQIGDTLVVGVKIDYSGDFPGVSDLVEESKILDAPLLAGNTMNYTFTKTFDLSTPGEYTVTAFTLVEDDPIFFGETSNDTAQYVAIVNSPYIDLGPDIFTVRPDLETLIATSTEPDITYNWYNNAGLVGSLATTSTFNVPTIDGGEFWVTLENLLGCTSVDNIIVHRLLADVGVSSFENPQSSCTLTAEEPFTVWITNYGTDTLKIGYTLTLGYQIGANPEVTGIEWVLTENVLPGDSIEYTFSGVTMDMSAIGSYPLKASATIANEYNTGNDQLSKTIEVWGFPTFDLGPNVEVTANEYIVDAGDGWTAYYWHNDESTDRYFTMETSGNVTATVYDANLCPATDNLYVSLVFTSIGIGDVVGPVTACEYTEDVIPQFKITNMGTNNLSAGTNITYSYSLGGILQESIVYQTTSILVPNDFILSDFTIPVDISSVGEHTFTFNATFAGDTKAEDDELAHVINVYGYPTPNLGEDVFTPAVDYVLDANTVADSYLWSTEETTSTITVTESGNYSVTATNGGMCSVEDNVNVTFLRHDYGISELLNPVSGCSEIELQTVSVIVKNFGTETLLAGDDILLGYSLNSNTSVEETFILGSDLTPGSSITFNFLEKIDLQLDGDYSINVYSSYVGDIDPINDEVNENFTVFPVPYTDLGQDTVIRSGQIVLDAGVGFANYLWNDNSTNQTLTVTETGNYSVTVFNIYGCPYTGSINIISLHPDYGATSISSPNSACALTSAETVSITVQNFGTDIIYSGETLQVKLYLNSVLKATEEIPIIEEFKPGDIIPYSFTTPLNLIAVGEYSITVSTFDVYDIDNTNDSFTKIINTWGNPTVIHAELNPNKFCENGSSILLTGGSPIGGVYTGNGVSESYFYPSIAGSGNHTITYTYTNPDNGCIAFKNITATVYATPVVTLPSFSPMCSNIEPFALTGGSPVGGTYTGTGVANGIFNPALAGGGIHTITYSYTDPNGCTEIATSEIEVYLAPNVTISDLPQICIDSPDFELTLGSPNGGEYSGVGVTEGYFSPADAGLGTHTITYTYTDANGCGDVVSTNVDVVETPTITLNNFTPICLNADPLELTGGLPAGGTYSGSGVVDGYFYPSSSSSGTHTITYVYTDPFGCSGSATNSIEVYPLTTVTLTEFNPICGNADEIQLTGGSPSGGTFSGNGVIDGFFHPDLVSAGTTNITYSFTDGNGCSNTADASILVYAIPLVNLGGDRSVNDPITLDAGSGFTSYLWQDESTNQTFNVTEPGTYSVTVVDANGCIGFDEVIIDFNKSLVNIISVLSPGENECFVSPMPIEISLKNDRTETLNIGSQLTMRYQIGTNNAVQETLTLSEALASGQSMNYSFTQQPSLSVQAHQITFRIDYLGVIGFEHTHSTTINPNPSVDLGPASLSVTFPFTLNAVVFGASNYLWSTGSTSPTTTVYSTAKYWLRVTNTYGCSASDTIYVHDATWVDEIPGIGAVVSVFPNPVKDWLTVKVETEKPGEFTFELFSPLGQKVYQQKQRAIQTFNNDINVSSYSPGVYLLRISAEGKWVTVRVIIQ